MSDRDAGGSATTWQAEIGPQQVEFATGSAIELRVERPQLLNSEQRGLTLEQDLSVLRGIVLQLVALVGDEAFAWGSGFLAAPGIGITAKHVCTEFKELGVGVSSEASLIAVGAIGSTAIVWGITQMLSIGGADLAILVLDRRTPWEGNLTLHLPEIHICAPKVDDLVFSYGFRASEVKFPRAEGKTSLGIMGLSSAGRVTEVYPNGRDKVNLPGPCFETDLVAVGGMSGGPVFDSLGRIIGLISSSFPPENSPTFVSLVWTAVFRNIRPIWPPFMYDEPTNLNAISQSKAKGRHSFLSYSDEMRWKDNKLYLCTDIARE